jgi:hypothetical protein
MNFYYIDYMIRERRREELEECERLRLLNSTGYSQSILIHQVCRDLFNAFHRLLKKRSFGHWRLQPCGSMPKVVAQTEGEG